MEKIMRRKLSLFIIMAAVLISAFAFGAVTSWADEFSLTNKGTASDGLTTVGRFYVEGKPAFCCDHEKITPPTGTRLTSSTRSDGDVAKVLYYGYGGPGQWSGFSGDEAAIVATSLALDHYFNDGTGNNNSSYEAFMKFLSTKDTSESGTSYTLYTSSELSYQRLASVNPVMNIKISVTKESADKSMTSGNECYSLEGAEYGVYIGGEKETTLKTNSAGKATGEITVNTGEAKSIKIKEIKSPAGYAIDSKVYERNGSSGSVSVVSKEKPISNPIDILLYKADSELLKTSESGSGKSGAGSGGASYHPQKGAALSGAVFKMDFYGIKSDEIPADGNYESLTPLRTWYFRSDEQGRVKYGKDYLAGGYEQDELYEDAAGSGKTALPLGFVTLKEVEAPKGYFINDKVFTAKISVSGTETVADTYNESVVPEVIKRGDLSFCKIKDGSQHRMPDVPFLITSLYENGQRTDDGESHVIVTDANGYASTDGSFNPHSVKTNANDAAWDGTAIDESKLVPEAGVWFGDSSAIADDRGALPYGRYRIDELPCESNRGYTLLSGIEIEVSRDGYTVEMGTLTDSGVEIGTSVMDKATGESGAMFAGEDITLTDRVEYKGLEKGVEYTVKGVLMDKATGKPVLVDGSEITATKTFVAESSDGSVDVDFTFDAGALKGKDTVVFETLVKGGVVAAVHEDINDKGQTMRFLSPDMKTTAKDGESGNKYSEADNSVTIVDTVEYSGLMQGQEYEIKGTLMDRSTGKPVVSGGKEVTDTITFVADKSDGTVELEFGFDASDLEGGDVVVFEDMMWTGKLIAEHKDINNTSQTVNLRKSDHIVATGDRFSSYLMIALVLMTISAIAASIVILRKES